MASTHEEPKAESVHLKYLDRCNELARQSPPKSTNFRVGCVIVSYPATGPEEILSTGYTLELEGNTHAEQCALSKLSEKHSVSDNRLNEVLRPELNTVLYTSLEPCGTRLSGNLPCVHRIIATTQGGDRGCGVQKVVFGAKEPGTFVQNSRSCELLSNAGIDWEYVSDLEAAILQVAMEGHRQDDANNPGSDSALKQLDEAVPKGKSIDDISEEERKRQAALPKNPKKRMMETVPRTTNDSQRNSS